ncbi:MAG: hypothetical protein AAB456_00255 [Patescibacteria group bacterium]
MSKPLYDFGQLVISRLGDLVGEMKEVGHLNYGLSGDEIKQVWRTAFEILGKTSAISRQKLSQNLKQK